MQKYKPLIIAFLGGLVLGCAGLFFSPLKPTKEVVKIEYREKKEEKKQVNKDIKKDVTIDRVRLPDGTVKETIKISEQDKSKINTETKTDTQFKKETTKEYTGVRLGLEADFGIHSFTPELERCRLNVDTPPILNFFGTQFGIRAGPSFEPKTGSVGLSFGIYTQF